MISVVDDGSWTTRPEQLSEYGDQQLALCRSVGDGRLVAGRNQRAPERQEGARPPEHHQHVNAVRLTERVLRLALLDHVDERLHDRFSTLRPRSAVFAPTVCDLAQHDADDTRPPRGDIEPQVDRLLEPLAGRSV